MEQLTITELIAKLQAILKEHGDLEVYHVEFGSCEKVVNVTVDTLEKETVVILE